MHDVLESDEDHHDHDHDHEDGHNSNDEHVIHPEAKSIEVCPHLVFLVVFTKSNSCKISLHGQNFLVFTARPYHKGLGRAIRTRARS